MLLAWSVLALAAGCDTVPTVGPEGIVPEEIAVYSPDPYADPGYPPQMGSIVAMIDGATVDWTIYDFSVGAYDASAWFGERDGVVRLTLIGYPPGDPRSDDGLVRLTAVVAGSLAAGTTLTDARVALVDGRDWDSPRLSGDATVTLDNLMRDQPQSGYGQISGTFSGVLCPAQGLEQPCQQIAGQFATQVQFDGL